MSFRSRLFPLVAGVALAASPAFAQSYMITATATASGEPNQAESTTTGTSVSASNFSVRGGSNPAVVNTSVAGSPSSANAIATATAQTTGSSTSGAGLGDFVLTSDEIYFSASGPFSVAVSLDASAALVVGASGGTARTEIEGIIRQRRSNGTTVESGSWNYEVLNDSGNGYRVLNDRRDTFAFDMQPGDFLQLTGFRVRASAGASANPVNQDSAANAASSGRVYVRVSQGTAAVSGSLSGEVYGEAPCDADFNGDGAANVLDVVEFIATWNTLGAGADVNEDGAINVLDVLAFITTWSDGCP